MHSNSLANVPICPLTDMQESHTRKHLMPLQKYASHIMQQASK